MNWADLRYGTVFRNTSDGSARDLTLLFIGVVEASDHINALLIDCDSGTATGESPAWSLGGVAKIDITDFWRFEVVE